MMNMLMIIDETINWHFKNMEYIYYISDNLCIILKVKSPSANRGVIYI